jgi:peptide/nickel transport system permease protein
MTVLKAARPPLVARSAFTLVFKLAVTLLALSLVVFVLTAAPADPARTLLGPTASPAQLALFRHDYGLDASLATRYLDWLGGALHGNLGRAYLSNTPVWQLIRPRLDRSLPLIAIAWLLMVAVGVPLGLASALRGGRLDKGVSLVSLALVAVPEFVLGTLLLTLLAVRLHWLPANSSAAGLVSSPLHALSAYVLPACTIAVGGAVSTLRLTRANAREVAAEPYVRAAVLRGLPPLRVGVRHVLPNAAPPVVGSLALRLAGLLGGMVVAENVFGFPGIGQLLVDSAESGDTPVVQAIVLIVGGAYVTINLLADSLVCALTPRRGTLRQ